MSEAGQKFFFLAVFLVGYNFLLHLLLFIVVRRAMWSKTLVSSWVRWFLIFLWFSERLWFIWDSSLRPLDANNYECIYTYIYLQKGETLLLIYRIFSSLNVKCNYTASQETSLNNTWIRICCLWKTQFGSRLEKGHLLPCLIHLWEWKEPKVSSL